MTTDSHSANLAVLPMLDIRHEIADYARLKPLSPTTDSEYQIRNSHWYFDIDSAEPEEVAAWRVLNPSAAKHFSEDPSLYLTLAWMSWLTLRPQISVWPKSYLVDKNCIEDPTLSLVFIKLLSMFGTKWNETLADLGPSRDGRTINQRQPGLVQFADVVFYRIVTKALGMTGLKMNVITDPMQAIDISPGNMNSPKRFGVCANENCLKLDVKTAKCSKCKVAYYCDAACQKADWHAGHKAECKALQTAHDKLPGKKQFDETYAKAQAAKRQGVAAPAR